MTEATTIQELRSSIVSVKEVANMIKAVTKFETEDGVLHHTREEAEDHESMKKFIMQVLDSHGSLEGIPPAHVLKAAWPEIVRRERAIEQKLQCPWPIRVNAKGLGGSLSAEDLKYCYTAFDVGDHQCLVLVATCQGLSSSGFPMNPLFRGQHFTEWLLKVGKEKT